MAASLSLADLNESVDYVDASQRRGDCQTWPLDSMLTVARRVAALYDECPDCEGGGEIAVNGDGAIISPGYPCSRCGGTGMVASPALLGRVASLVLGATVGPVVFPDALARYLFGDTP